jgi:hypothetical protein
MSGCGCKKKNQTTNNQTINVSFSEPSTNHEPQNVTIIEQHVDQIIKKVEEISDKNNSGD